AKLRILAASASLGDSEEAARAYLEEFFAVEQRSFAILRGTPRDLGTPPDGALPAEAVETLASIGRPLLCEVSAEDSGAASVISDPAAFAREHGLPMRLVELARDANGGVGAQSAERLAAALLPATDADRAREALTGALSLLAAIPK